MPGASLWLSTTVPGSATTDTSSGIFVGTVVSANAYTVRSLVLANVVAIQSGSGAVPMRASWPAGTTRHYAVDYVNGSNSNIGYSDVSMAAAGLVAVKTLEYLKTIVPLIAQGQRLFVCLKGAADNQTAITYYKADGVTVDDADFRGLTGYQQILLRSTQDFSDAATDKTVCAPVVAIAGPGVLGEFTVAGGATASVFTIASGPLVAEAALGFRVRFTGNVTAALANQSRMVWKNTSSVITLGLDASVAPALNDTFYIEGPGVIVNQVFGCASIGGGGGSTQKAFYEFGVVGIRCLQTVVTSRQNFSNIGVQFAFTEFDKAPECFNLTALNAIETYFEASSSLTPVNVGFGFRIRSNNGQDTQHCGITNIICSSVITGQEFIFNGSSGNGLVGRGCVFGASLNFIGSSVTAHALLFGNQAAPTYRYARFYGGAVLKTNQGGSLDLRGVDFSGCGAASCIQRAAAGTGGTLRIAEITSVDGGNTAYVLDMLATTLGAKNVFVHFDLGAPTATATLGDIRASDGVILTFAQIQLDQVVDGGLCTYIGVNAGTRIKRQTPGIFYNVPILGADPATPLNGDVWITNIAGTKNLCAYIAGATARTLLT